ncbi:uncharacterized protein [Cicer arietinum]
MTCLFVGPKNSLALKNLRWLKISECEKLEIVFSVAVIRYLPQLKSLIIEQCEELKQIIEDDLENQKTSNSLSSETCFPKLEVLYVAKCNKLKSVFPDSICKKLPELKLLIIIVADELEEIFKSEGHHKVEIPNLKVVTFYKLPSLCDSQGIPFQAVKSRFVQDCQKLSLTSAFTHHTFSDIIRLCFNSEIHDEAYTFSMSLFKKLQQESEGHHTSNENPSADFAASEFELTSSQELMNKKSMDEQCLMNQQHPLGEIDTTVQHSHGNNEYGDGKIAIPSFSISNTEPHTIEDVDLEDSQKTTQTNNNQVSLNDEAFKKVSSNIEEQFPKADEIIVSKSKPSPIASQLPSMPSKGDPSQIMEDLSTHSLVMRELEQLVSMKHLAYENLSLLTDFLVKHPSVRLKDPSLRNRYKGCAYNLLAELLKFLQTHSVLDASGSFHSEFVELLLDARNFGFDKDWLDGVEKRALFPELQVSQEALQK